MTLPILRRRALALSCSILLLLSCRTAKGQNYFSDFELTTKTGYALDTLAIDGYSWALEEAVVTNHASDVKNGQRAVRFRHGNSSASMIMTQDKNNGLGRIAFYYARSAFAGDRTGATPNLVVDYSTDSGLTWQNIDTLSLAGKDSLTAYQSDTLNIPGSVRLKIYTTGSGSGKRLNLDDLLVTPYVLRRHLELLAWSPRDSGIHPATDTLTLTFDENIALSSGTITLHETSGSGSIQTITIPSGQVTVKDSGVTIRGIMLQQKSAYYILLTEACFTNATGTLPNPAISDSTYWTFYTADTSTIRPIREMDEHFTLCSDSLTATGLFRQYSIAGRRIWQCTPEGREDSFAIGMLGGIAQGLSETNNDWLISTAPLDLSAMSEPLLSFWQKKRYEGFIERDIRISTDYKGTGDPEVAHWQILEVQAMTASPANYWTPVTDISLDSIKYQPFYLAFTYRCDTSGAYEILYDDILISNKTLFLPATKQDGFEARLITPDPGVSSFRLRISSSEHAPLLYQVVEASGRSLFQGTLTLHKGVHIYDIPGGSFASGLYYIQLWQKETRKVLKAFR